MYVSELVIEVTRRCNLECAHCLRGKAQRKDIDNVTVDKLLEGVTSIGTLTFTGGEPSLAVDRIKYIVQQIKHWNINLDAFYVVTNGKQASVELALVLIELYAYCQGEKGKHGEHFIGGLTMSQDQYHQAECYDYQPAMDLYSGLTFFRPDERKGDIDMPYDEGLAKDNGIGERIVDLNRIGVEVDDYGDVTANDGPVYINALGDVVPACDLSYQSQDELKIGNVHNNTLKEILTAYVKLEEVEV